MASRQPFGPDYYRQDLLVLKSLIADLPNDESAKTQEPELSNEEIIRQLRAWNDPKHPEFSPAVWCTWDEHKLQLPPWANSLLKAYIRFALKHVRHPGDVVELTHYIFYYCVVLPSALCLFHSFSWPRAVGHMLVVCWFLGTASNTLHHHHHVHGILVRDGGFMSWVDRAWPHVIGPLVGFSWNSYHYHHKQHHVEDNGPRDLSSTLWLQRDRPLDLLKYVSRFLLLISIEMPIYYFRKGWYKDCAGVVLSEYSSFAAFWFLYLYVSKRAAVTTLLVPFILMRLTLMIANFGQHALIDHDDPDSPTKSTVTVIDVTENRHNFNAGYHLTHHFNPRRHWRDSPAAFVKDLERTKRRGTTIFYGVQFMHITYWLMTKNYAALEKAMIPIGAQVDMTVEERIQMLKGMARKFTDEEIRKHYPKKMWK